MKLIKSLLDAIRRVLKKLFNTKTNIEPENIKDETPVFNNEEETVDPSEIDDTVEASDDGIVTVESTEEPETEDHIDEHQTLSTDDLVSRVVVEKRRWAKSILMEATKITRDPESPLVDGDTYLIMFHKIEDLLSHDYVKYVKDRNDVETTRYVVDGFFIFDIPLYSFTGTWDEIERITSLLNISIQFVILDGNNQIVMAR